MASQAVTLSLALLVGFIAAYPQTDRLKETVGFPHREVQPAVLSIKNSQDVLTFAETYNMLHETQGKFL